MTRFTAMAWEEDSKRPVFLDEIQASDLKAATEAYRNANPGLVFQWVKPVQVLGTSEGTSNKAFDRQQREAKEAQASEWESEIRTEYRMLGEEVPSDVREYTRRGVGL